MDEFYEEHLPSKDVFAFCVNGTMLVAKKCAFELIERKVVVEFVDKGVKHTVSDVNQSAGEAMEIQVSRWNIAAVVLLPHKIGYRK